MDGFDAAILTLEAFVFFQRMIGHARHNIRYLQNSGLKGFIVCMNVYATFILEHISCEHSVLWKELSDNKYLLSVFLELCPAGVNPFPGNPVSNRRTCFFLEKQAKQQLEPGGGRSVTCVQLESL